MSGFFRRRTIDNKNIPWPCLFWIHITLKYTRLVKSAIIWGMEYRDKRVAVIGFGTEGKSAVDFMLWQKAKISVFDEKEEASFGHSVIEPFDSAQGKSLSPSTPLRLNNQAIEQLRTKGVQFAFGPLPSLSAFDVIIRSPGVRLHHPRLTEINPRKTAITSVTKIFFNRCPCPIVGVTGTKGKGTTATLIYEMLINGGKDAYLGGNIGVPPLTFLPKLTQFSRVVLELSSFQLIDLTKSPHVAVILMVTNEHQDYHRGQDEYRDTKEKIIAFQRPDDFAVVCMDYEQSRLIGTHARGTVYWYSRQKSDAQCFVRDGMMVWRNGGKEEEILPVADIRIPGKHNWENVCAAATVAKILHIPNKIFQNTVRQFTGLPHRLQFVGAIDGVQFYDDSFSTTPETTIAAIEALDKPKVLILGGSGKQSDFSSLAQTIRHMPGIRAVIGIGEEWKRIKEALLTDPMYQMRIMKYDQDYAVQPPATIKAHGKTVIEGCRTMQDIVHIASRLANPGDVVLLSPACASFGMFQNYKDRGDQFIQAVHALQGAQSMA